MKLTRCDNHPDRDAVVTVSIRTYPPGVRPLFGFESTSATRKFYDFCEECKEQVPLKLEDFNVPERARSS